MADTTPPTESDVKNLIGELTDEQKTFTTNIFSSESKARRLLSDALVTAGAGVALGFLAGLLVRSRK